MPDDHSLESIVQRMQHEEAEQRKQARQTLTAVCDHLKLLNVTAIDISYDGCGDSGTIDSVTARNGEAVIQIPSELVANLEEAACDLLPAGWEINDGSFGELVLDVVARKILRQHSWRSTEYDEEEFNL